MRWPSRIPNGPHAWLAHLRNPSFVHTHWAWWRLVMAPKERETALRQLDEAYSVLQQAVEAGESSTLVQTPVSTALAMLEIVEHIDPTLVREFFWRAISLRTNTTFGSERMALGPYGPKDGMRLSDPVLAACLALRRRGGSARPSTAGRRIGDRGGRTIPPLVFFFVGNPRSYRDD